MTTQYWIAGASGDWSDAADWVSGAVPGSTDGVVIAYTYGYGEPQVTVDGTAAAYSLTLDTPYATTLTVSGTLTLGTALTVNDYATLKLSGGTLSAQSISSNNNGYLFGYGVVSGAVSGGVRITADGGALQVQGSLAGDQGNFTIDGGATLELSSAAAAPVIFDGNSATFKLDAPAAFTGAIEGVVVGDAFDLAGITASSATYSGTALTIHETNGQHLTYGNVTGSLAGEAVQVASDNEGGTDVYWGAAPAATTQYWKAGASGDWSDAADWVSGAVPGSTDGVVIAYTYGYGEPQVTVDGTAAAYSLTLDTPYATTLTVSGTLTLGTALTVNDYATLKLSGGTLSAQSISSNNNGYLFGYGVVSGAVSGGVRITADGGALQVQGSLAGDQGNFTIDGGATLELSSAAAAPVIFNGGSATFKLDAPAAFTGAIEAIVVGDTIDLAGITASSASYSGTALTIHETNGQHLTYGNVTGSLTGDAVTVGSDNKGRTDVYWGAAPATTQYWIAGASGDWSDAADWVSGAVPGSTDGVVIAYTYGYGEPQVTVDGTAAAYSLTLDTPYATTLTVSGTLTLGTALTVNDYATLKLSGGTLSAQSISSNNNGYLFGYGVVSGAVSGGVRITADGGALQVQGSLAGDQGNFTIDGGATLELSSAAAAPVIFDGNSATFKLDAPAAFTGAIEGVVVGDAFDLAGIAASSATYSGTTLTIHETNGQHLTYGNVTGSLAGEAVQVASDNEGGTDVYWGAAPAATTQYWKAGASGDWSDAADWVSGAVPGSTDGVVIAYTYGYGEPQVTVDGTAAAYSLTLDTPYATTLTVSGTLTLGTALTVDDYATLKLSGGTLSAQSISSNNNGYLFGYGVVSGAVSGGVRITADGGALQVQGSLAGDQGNFTIDGGATLELSSAAAAPVIFDGNSATFKLDAPAAFTGAIEGVVVGDAIDLAGITASSATYSGSTLTINETNDQHLTYGNVTGSLAGEAVQVASDNEGGDGCLLGRRAGGDDPILEGGRVRRVVQRGGLGVGRGSRLDGWRGDRLHLWVRRAASDRRRNGGGIFSDAGYPVCNHAHRQRHADARDGADCERLCDVEVERGNAVGAVDLIQQ